jgi:hypothetical protein
MRHRTPEQKEKNRIDTARRLKLRVRERREKGICVDCGSSELETSWYCFSCAKYHSEQVKKSLGYVIPKVKSKYQILSGATPPGEKE